MANHVFFTNKELKEFIRICSSVSHDGTFHPKVILTANGKPVEIDVFMEAIGERKLKVTPDFSKTQEEKEQIRVAKRAAKYQKH